MCVPNWNTHIAFLAILSPPPLPSCRRVTGGGPWASGRMPTFCRGWLAGYTWLVGDCVSSWSCYAVHGRPAYPAWRGLSCFVFDCFPPLPPLWCHRVSPMLHGRVLFAHELYVWHIQCASRRNALCRPGDQARPLLVATRARGAHALSPALFPCTARTVYNPQKRPRQYARTACNVLPALTVEQSLAMPSCELAVTFSWLVCLVCGLVIPASFCSYIPGHERRLTRIPRASQQHLCACVAGNAAPPLLARELTGNSALTPEQQGKRLRVGRARLPLGTLCSRMRTGMRAPEVLDQRSVLDSTERTCTPPAR